MSEHSKAVAVCGDEEFALGFRLAGVTRSAITTNAEEFQTAIAKFLDDRGVGIVITQATDVAALPTQLRLRVTDCVNPVVIQMGAGASSGLREKVRNAIGIDLLKD